MADAKAYLCEKPNPLDPEDKEKMGIHHGFYGKI